jgi:hypothetical protein
LELLDSFSQQIDTLEQRIHSRLAITTRNVAG